MMSCDRSYNVKVNNIEYHMFQPYATVGDIKKIAGVDPAASLETSDGKQKFTNDSEIIDFTSSSYDFRGTPSFDSSTV